MFYMHIMWCDCKSVNYQFSSLYLGGWFFYNTLKEGAGISALLHHQSLKEYCFKVLIVWLGHFKKVFKSPSKRRKGGLHHVPSPQLPSHFKSADKCPSCKDWIGISWYKYVVKLITAHVKSFCVLCNED